MKCYSNNGSDFGELVPFFRDVFGFEPIVANKNTYLMRTNLKETDKNYEMSIELPSVKKEDVEINIDNGYLVISVHQKQVEDKNEENGKYVLHERKFYNTSRSYYFGDVLKEENVNAKMENGVLLIDITKPLPVEPKKSKIEIK